MLYYLLFVFPFIALASLLLYLPFCLIRKRTVGRRPFLRHLTCYALIGVTLSILYITIFMSLISGVLNAPVSYHLLNLTPFIWVQETYTMGFFPMLKQLALNIVMTIPLGLFLPAVFPSLRRWWKTVLVTVGFITCIEIVQYFIGRSCDVDDLIMNTAGGSLGFGLFTLLNALFKNSEGWKDALTP